MIFISMLSTFIFIEYNIERNLQHCTVEHDSYRYVVMVID